jgi:AAA family ATP:ADP antiporter
MQSLFLWIKELLFPISDTEAKKVLPLALMMLCVLFNYTILRDIKDSLILTSHGCGSECISFLKLWGTLPFALITVALYGRLANVLSKPILFRVMVISFATFFAIFAYVIFPNADLFHASPEWIASASEAYPRMRYCTALIGNWSFAMFYIVAELWGTMGLSVLFWQFANEITKVHEAKRFYPLFGFIGNIGVIISGSLLVIVSNLTSHMSDKERWSISLTWIIASILVICVGLLYLHYWVQNNVMTDSRLHDVQNNATNKKSKKVKLSFTESIRIVFKSKYLGFIAIFVLAYGITINFVEAVLKNQIKLLYPNPADMTRFYGYYSTCTGIATMFLMIMGANLTRKYSWRICALITPMTVLIAGGAFFMLVMFKEQAALLFSCFNITPIAMAVIVGAALVVITKGAKYSLFDPTKEMAYIPLDDQLKTQGKAAVDGVGGRLGKSGGGMIQQVFFVLISGSTQMTIAPYLGGILILVSLFWIYSVFGLSNMFEKKMSELKEKEEA